MEYAIWECRVEIFSEPVVGLGFSESSMKTEHRKA